MVITTIRARSVVIVRASLQKHMIHPSPQVAKTQIIVDLYIQIILANVCKELIEDK